MGGIEKENYGKKPPGLETLLTFRLRAPSHLSLLKRLLQIWVIQLG